MVTGKPIAEIYRERWNIGFFYKKSNKIRASKILSATRKMPCDPDCTALVISLFLNCQKFLRRLGLSVQQIFQRSRSI
jgi:hypothetical protein